MNTKIYSGQVIHHRFSPAEHTLRYPVYFYAFDLDELEKLHREIRFFSYNARNIVSLWDCDYLFGDGSIKKRLMKILENRPYGGSIRRVMLVTSARFCGYVFNPVSFFHCFDKAGGLVCVVAEVNNTFGERHIYILDGKQRAKRLPVLYRQDKQFHVSPFNNLEGYYELGFSELGENASMSVTLFRNSQKIMTAHLSGAGAALSSSELAGVLRRFPVTALLTVFRIYREAAKLFFVKKLKYHKKPVPSHEMTISLKPPSTGQRFARSVIIYFLKKFMSGSIEAVFPDGTKKTLRGPYEGPGASISIRDNRFFWKLIKQGDIGFGEAFVGGMWNSPDVTGLLDFIIANMQLFEQRNSSLRNLSHRVKKLTHPVRRNTRKGSRKNISEHYDLGNDFFRTFLDKRLLYSCGIYRNPGDSLEQAQLNKVREIMSMAKIGKGDSVLEIGSGWGGFAVEAVRSTGCRVTTVTVSRKQYEYVTALVKKLGMNDSITILFRDYRDIEGSFDRIISIEMLEAIGVEYFGAFFKKCESLLKPQGIMAHQIIMIPDHRLDRYLRTHDWMRKHIFPGGELPSLSVIVEAMKKNSTFFVQELRNIGPHYARTLYDWRMRFSDSADKLLAMGYDAEFQRKWLYYLMICEASFKSRIIYDSILVFSRQYNRTIPYSDSFEYGKKGVTGRPSGNRRKSRQ